MYWTARVLRKYQLKTRHQSDDLNSFSGVEVAGTNVFYTVGNMFHLYTSFLNDKFHNCSNSVTVSNALRSGLGVGAFQLMWYYDDGDVSEATNDWLKPPWKSPIIRQKWLLTHKKPFSIPPNFSGARFALKMPRGTRTDTLFKTMEPFKRSLTRNYTTSYRILRGWYSSSFRYLCLFTHSKLMPVQYFKWYCIP